MPQGVASASWQGACSCGAVQFRVEGPSLFCAHCHCSYCRRAHGAAFVTWVGIAEGRFSLLRGASQMSWHQSSQQSRRGFCGDCGTTLFFASTLCPGEMHVTRASIAGEIDREPQCHVFADQAVSWGSEGDGLPRYSAGHPALAKYQAVKPDHA